MKALNKLDLEVAIWTMPQEMSDPIPFELDDRHTANLKDIQPIQFSLNSLALAFAKRLEEKPAVSTASPQGETQVR